jgi:hypothetical protein
MARTTTVGGTTSGYSLIGKRRSDSAPAMKMIADKTPAKMGRLMKYCEKLMGVPLERAGCRGLFGRHGAL